MPVPHIQLRPGRARMLATALAFTLVLAGCAGKPAQGYGLVTPQSTAEQAQQQMQSAQQAAQTDTRQTYLDLIAQMQQAGQWYASLAHAEAFEQQYGLHTQARLLRADALRNTGQHQPAHQAYMALLSNAESTTVAARARRGLGLLHASQGQYAQAAAELEMARQLNPIDANVLSDLAYAYMLDGRLAPAQLPMRQAAQLAPGHAKVQLNLALYWLATDHQAEAADLLQRLSQPQAQRGQPLIDQASLQMLQTQLATIQEAVRLRSRSGTHQTPVQTPAQTPPLAIHRQIPDAPQVQAEAGGQKNAPPTAAAADTGSRDSPL